MTFFSFFVYRGRWWEGAIIKGHPQATNLADLAGKGEFGDRSQGSCAREIRIERFSNDDARLRQRRAHKVDNAVAL